MSDYILKLYKRGESDKILNHEVQRIIVHALDDAAAVGKARVAQIPYGWDNSDYAVLISADGRHVHRWSPSDA